MSSRQKWRNGNAPKDRKKGRNSVIVQIILWIGEKGSGNMLFFALLHRMNIMKKSLPTNNSEPPWLHFLQSSGNVSTLITY